MHKLVKINTDKGYVSSAINLPSVAVKGVALLMPGYLDSKDYDGLAELGKDLAELGYVAIRFDATGTWDSSGRIQDYTTTQRLKDIDFVLYYVKENYSSLPIWFMGHSMGGMIALLYAARHNTIAGVVAIMAPYAFVRPNNKEEKDEESQWAKDGFHISRRDLPDNPSEKREFKVPYSIVIDSYQYDVSKEVKNIKAPILLIAGEKDDVVVPADVELIYKEASQPKEIITIPNVGHDYRHHSDEIKIVNSAVINYLNK